MVRTKDRHLTPVHGRLLTGQITDPGAVRLHRRLTYTSGVYLTASIPIAPLCMRKDFLLASIKYCLLDRDEHL